MKLSQIWLKAECDYVFINRLQQYVNECIDLIEISNKNETETSDHGGLLTPIRIKDELKKKCALVPNDQKVKIEYKQCRNHLSRIIKKSKCKYYKNKEEKKTE